MSSSVRTHFNYDIDHLMFYDNATTYQGAQYSYNWTEVEVQHMRSWLDTNGHQDVNLIWNARNFSQANQNWAENPVVDHVMIEGSADRLPHQRQQQDHSAQLAMDQSSYGRQGCHSADPSL